MDQMVVDIQKCLSHHITMHKTQNTKQHMTTMAIDGYENR